MAVRVRFAPSPTGKLHLGGFRTALLNYLFARRNNGKFILRIEDTDQTRLVPGATEQLESDLNWLRIPPDESPSVGGPFGPYVQSQRLKYYHEYAEKLLGSSAGYECFCSEKRLELIRKEAVRAKAKPGYDNKCRSLSRSQVVAKKAAGERYVVRVKLDPTPVTFEDALYGKITLVDKNDPVMIKRDGFPTYHFANVVDDFLMEISHVLRGLEWQISTGIHLQLYRALGFEPPKFAHLPVLLNKDGSKLSKRQADICIQNYRDEGCSPLALTNFVTKSGGGFYHHVDKLLTLDELADEFDLSMLNQNSCKLDFNLLDELSKVCVHQELEDNFSNILLELKAKHPTADEDYLRRVLNWCKPRITKIRDLYDMSYLWEDPVNVKIQTPKSHLEAFSQSDVTKVAEFVKAHGLNKKEFMRDIRLILCGKQEGPPIAELIDLLGTDRVKHRIEAAVAHQ